MAAPSRGWSDLAVHCTGGHRAQNRVDIAGGEHPAQNAGTLHQCCPGPLAGSGPCRPYVHQSSRRCLVGEGDPAPFDLPSQVRPDTPPCFVWSTMAPRMGLT